MIGCGAVDDYFCGRLAQQGHQVTFVDAWGALAAIDNKSVGELRFDNSTEVKLAKIIKEYAVIGNALPVAITDETLTFIYSLSEHSQTSMQRDIANEKISEFDVLVEYPYKLSIKYQLETPELRDCY